MKTQYSGSVKKENPTLKFISCVGVLLCSLSLQAHLLGPLSYPQNHVLPSEFDSKTGYYNFLDKDGDGLSDRMDWDIDGDLVPNTLDSHPFDPAKGGEDTNQNEIYDFVEIRKTGGGKSSIQSSIFKKHNIIVAEIEEEFSVSQWKILEDILSLMSPFIVLGEIKVIAMKVRPSWINDHSSFDPFWKEISFYPNSLHEASDKFFTNSLIHELFHGFESGTSRETPTRKLLKWCRDKEEKAYSPSLYGGLNARECFAESLTAVFTKKFMTLDQNRFSKYKDWKKTRGYKLALQIIEQGLN